MFKGLKSLRYFLIFLEEAEIAEIALVKMNTELSGYSLQKSLRQSRLNDSESKSVTSLSRVAEWMFLAEMRKLTG